MFDSGINGISEVGTVSEFGTVWIVADSMFDSGINGISVGGGGIKETEERSGSMFVRLSGSGNRGARSLPVGISGIPGTTVDLLPSLPLTGRGG
ncbi:uncharacterized protein GIQ15_04973 [Arthroderma uncinatum]|uniref:uncharacterized protein n=1 Tax=Arthroderma uncinatum TaxID=74035 RepID=UPI00144A8426|nr:uncharacterized protein GIQ15_04973 [Arthroderma uncinatum]KAF3482214.1 hypothetical protein GIQ15_04973 [Arthroderma uncinatum]